MPWEIWVVEKGQAIKDKKRILGPYQIEQWTDDLISSMEKMQHYKRVIKVEVSNNPEMIPNR